MVDLESVRDRLAAFLQDQHGAPVEIGDLEVLTGGYSLVTVAFSAITPDGTANYVLRTNPPSDAALTQGHEGQRGSRQHHCFQEVAPQSPGTGRRTARGAVRSHPAYVRGAGRERHAEDRGGQRGDDQDRQRPAPAR